MADFIMQVKSAIAIFVCTLESEQNPYYMRYATNTGRACPCATKYL
jgi:hypothetical protein